MKKFIIPCAVLVISLVSCKKQIEETVFEKEFAEQPSTSCGTEQAMKSMPAALLDEIRGTASRTNLQAGELLLFLKFDGARVIPGANPTAQGGLIISPIVRFQSICPPSILTAANRAKVVKLVEDDFAPFNILVTTSQEVYDNYPPALRQSCLITTIPQVLGFSGGTGGVAPWAGPGPRLTFTSFVFGSLFGNDVHSIADVISHEVGHTLGLDHQHLYSETCNSLFEYHPGFGQGPLSFAPIMGNGTKSVSNWFAQPCALPLYNIVQDDFETINTHVNLRPDDFSNEIGDKQAAAPGTVGILEQSGDVDFLYITPHAPSPVTVVSENIDLKVTLYNPGGQVLGVFNDEESTNVSIPTVRGVAYLKIEAASNNFMDARFMTGQYTVSY